MGEKKGTKRRLLKQIKSDKPGRGIRGILAKIPQRIKDNFPRSHNVGTKTRGLILEPQSKYLSKILHCFKAFAFFFFIGTK